MLPAGQRRQPKARLPVAIQAGCIPTNFPAILCLHPTLLPDSLEDYVTEDNPVRVVDVFIDELDLEALGFSGAMPEMTAPPPIMLPRF